MLENLTKVSPENISKITCFDDDASNISQEHFSPRPDICFIDGEHTNKAVLSDFLFCQSIINPSGIIVFHDSNIIFSALTEIIHKHLLEQSKKFSAYNLPIAIFVIEPGNSSIYSDGQVRELLTNNYLGYLAGLKSLLPYREFAIKHGFTQESS